MLRRIQLRATSVALSWCIAHSTGTSNFRVDGQHLNQFRISMPAKQSSGDTHEIQKKGIAS
jgi:hypothetical protein